MIVLILLGITAWFSFEIGRRYQRGIREVEQDRREVRHAEVGRRSTMRLKPLRIRR